MTGFRTQPSEDLLREVVSCFITRPDLHHAIEIYMERLNSQMIVDNMNSLYPLLEVYYYPGKLRGLLTHEKNETTGNIMSTFTIDSCVCILRQIFRASGYRVRTRSVRKNNLRHKIIILIPPVIIT